MKKYNVIIIEDDIQITDYIISNINASTNYQVSKTYTNPKLFLTDTDQVFDIILLDVVMPEMNGIDAILPILAKYPEASIIMNTIMDNSETIFSALKFGVVGYIDKQYFEKNYSEVFDIVINGGAYITPKIARKVVSSFNNPNVRLEKLTERENEIAHAIIQGLSYKLIADRFSVSIDTVRIHIKSIYRKLKINSKGELFSIVSNNS
jgi:DNA-binding NarL/FixJ family response regulator